MADKEVVIAVKFEFCCSVSTRDLDFVATFSNQEKGHPISKMLERARQQLNPPPNVDLPIKLTLQSGYVLTQGPFVDPASESDAYKVWDELADRAIPGHVPETDLPGQTVHVSLYTHGKVVARQLMQCGNGSNKNCAEFLYLKQQWKEQNNYWVLKALVDTFQAGALFIVDRITDRDTYDLMKRVLQVLLGYSDAQKNTKLKSGSSAAAVAAAVWNNDATKLLHRRGLLDSSEVVVYVIGLLDVHLKADNQMKHLIKLLPGHHLHRQHVIEALVSKAPRDHLSLFEQGLLPGKWKSNASVMLAAVKNDHVAFNNDVAFELREDPGFVRDCIKASPPVMQYVRNPMMQIVFEKYPGFDKDIMHVPYAKVNLSPRWTETNRDFVADAIKHNPERLKYAPFQLRSDLEFAGRAVELGASLEHAGHACIAHACIADPGFVHKAVRLNGLNIRFVPEASVSLDLALEAIKQLQTTTDVLWAAVQASVTDGSSKEDAVQAFYGQCFVVHIGIDAVFEAVKHHFSDFKLAANAVLLCRGYVHNTQNLIQMWPSTMLDNIEMAKFVAGLQIPDSWTHELQLFSVRIRSDAACMRALVEAAGDPLLREVANKATHRFPDSGDDSCVCMQIMTHAAPELWNDRDLVLKVLSLTTNKRVLQLVGPELRADFEVVKLACAKNPLSVQWASKEQQTRSRVLNAVREDAFVLPKLSSEWQRDFETCLAAVKQEQLAFKYVHHTLLNNGKFVLEAMSVVRDFDFVWRTYVSAKLRRNKGGFKAQCMSAWQKGAANNAN